MFAVTRVRPSVLASEGGRKAVGQWFGRHGAALQAPHVSRIPTLQCLPWVESGQSRWQGRPMRAAALVLAFSAAAAAHTGARPSDAVGGFVRRTMHVNS